MGSRKTDGRRERIPCMGTSLNSRGFKNTGPTPWSWASFTRVPGDK